MKSLIALPLKPGDGRLLGVITFDTLINERAWSEARLALAAKSAESGIWDMDLKSQTFWATDLARQLFGCHRDEVIDVDLFEKSIHPDDRAMVKRLHREIL